jgi:hypothetical protein
MICKYLGVTAEGRHSFAAKDDSYFTNKVGDPLVFYDLEPGQPVEIGRDGGYVVCGWRSRVNGMGVQAFVSFSEEETRRGCSIDIGPMTYTEAVLPCP